MSMLSGPAIHRKGSDRNADDETRLTWPWPKATWPLGALRYEWACGQREV